MGDEGDEGDDSHEGDESNEGYGCNEGDEGDEGEEKRRPVVKGGPRRSARGSARSQKVGLLQTPCRPRGHWCQGGEKQRIVHSTRTVQDQDQGEACDKGR